MVDSPSPRRTEARTDVAWVLAAMADVVHEQPDDSAWETDTFVSALRPVLSRGDRTSHPPTVEADLKTARASPTVPTDPTIGSFSALLTEPCWLCPALRS